MINVPRVIGIILIVFVGYIIVSLIIKSDKDMIKELVKDAGTAIEQEDIDKCLSFIYPEYDYEGINYEALRKHIARALEEVKPEKNKIIEQAITIKGKEADLRLKVITHPGRKSSIFRPFGTSWRFKLVKKDKKWWIVEIEYLAE